MKVKIAQPAGLGDIFFCLKIARTIAKENIVYWPVIPPFSWLKDYLIFDNIIWEDISNPDYTLELQTAARLYPTIPIMAAKYEMVNMSFDDWKDHFIFKRNIEKENELFNLIVTKEPYCLVSENFGTAGTQTRYVPFHEEMVNFKVFISDKYNPFDWCKIIENASELRFVDTSFTYIIETLNLKAEKIKLYSRHREGFQTDYLWKKPWTYID